MNVCFSCNTKIWLGAARRFDKLTAGRAGKPSYRIQYVLDGLNGPDPLIARTDLVLAASVQIAERMAKSEMTRYEEAVGFRVLDSADRVVVSQHASIDDSAVG
jgi:hypothetical protein